MIHFVLFFVTLFSTPATSLDIAVCIGDRCNGSKVSIDYLEKNPKLTHAQKDYQIQSFHVAYFVKDGSLRDASLAGDDFSKVLPAMRENAQPGSKLFFDEIVLSATDGRSVKTAAIFVLE